MPKSPTRQLAEEHEYVLLVVGAMEAEAARIEETGTVDVERVSQMIDFSRNYTEGDHHVKEESMLFPLLAERSREAGGTVSVLLSEHESARDCIRAISAALSAVEDEDEGRAVAARGVIVDNLLLYAYLLPLHIGKEDTILFGLTERLLSVRELEMLAEDFDALGTTPGASVSLERYRRMARDLAGPSRR